MNKTVRSLLLLYRCYGRTLPADDLLDLFAVGTVDVNTQRRTLRRYLEDFRRAGVAATWSGRGARATVHIPASEVVDDVRGPAAVDDTTHPELVIRLQAENAVLLRRLDSERAANDLFRDLLRRQSKSGISVVGG